MGFYSIESDKIKYGWGIKSFKMQKQVTVGFFSIENAEIRHSWGFILLKLLKGADVS